MAGQLILMQQMLQEVHIIPFLIHSLLRQRWCSADKTVQLQLFGENHQPLMLQFHHYAAPLQNVS
jgi:hypothetical protein